MKTAQEVTRDFFEVVFRVIAGNSSKSYGLVVMKNIKDKLSNEHKFLEFVHLTDSKIIVDKQINMVRPKKIAGFFEGIIDMLGPQILKILIKERLDKEDISFLNRIGVEFQ